MKHPLFLLGLTAIILLIGCKKEKLTCEIVSPKDGATLSIYEDLVVKVEANNTKSTVTSVTVYLDNLPYPCNTTAPYTAIIRTEFLTLGKHTIKAVVVNKEGTKVESFIIVNIVDGGGSDGFVIDAKNIQNSSSMIATAYALIYYEEDVEPVVLVSTKYQNNSFKLTLPATVANKFLCSVGENFYTHDDWVSNNSAKIGVAYLKAWNSGKNYIGQFWYCYMESPSGSPTLYNVFEDYVYADRDFNWKGKEISEFGFVYESDCSFKKGWNIIYYVSKFNGGNSSWLQGYYSKKPSEVTMEWHYFEDTKSAKKSFFEGSKFHISKPNTKSLH